jgi:hypothetical protein
MPCHGAEQSRAEQFCTRSPAEQSRGQTEAPAAPSLHPVVPSLCSSTPPCHAISTPTPTTHSTLKHNPSPFAHRQPCFALAGQLLFAPSPHDTRTARSHAALTRARLRCRLPMGRPDVPPTATAHLAGGSPQERGVMRRAVGNATAPKLDCQPVHSDAGARLGSC